MNKIFNYLVYGLLLVGILTFVGGCGSDNSAEKEAPPEKKVEQTPNLNIEINTTIGNIKDGKLEIDVATNVIDGAELMVSVGDQFVWREKHGIDENATLTDEQGKKIRAETYSASDKQIVKDGKIHCVFSGEKLKPGTYDVTVSMSIPKLQKDKKVAEVYGDYGDNFAEGPCIRNGTTGKVISKTERVEIK